MESQRSRDGLGPAGEHGVASRGFKDFDHRGSRPRRTSIADGPDTRTYAESPRYRRRAATVSPSRSGRRRRGQIRATATRRFLRGRYCRTGPREHGEEFAATARQVGHCAVRSANGQPAESLNAELHARSFNRLLQADVPAADASFPASTRTSTVRGQDRRCTFGSSVARTAGTDADTRWCGLRVSSLSSPVLYLTTAHSSYDLNLYYTRKLHKALCPILRLELWPIRNRAAPVGIPASR